ncbi:MAG: hypothetical protein FJ216_07145 [Ignavibacteria bacterium]|nr:hypothetical protein [Ignavibacteria bacterium]
MKILLLRVGIDSRYNALSPVFKDFTFEYIPIYYKDKKDIEKKEKRTFRNLIGSKGKPLSEYLPEKIKDKKIHFDPEFETFTYGEVKNPKRSALLKLGKNDLLVFYMGGYFVNKSYEKQCFIFGFFEVDKVYDWTKKNERGKIIKECEKNAHIISSKTKDNLVIVKGTNRSRLLEKCIQITDKCDIKGIPYLTKPEFYKNYDIREFIVRATPIWIKQEKKINNLQLLLKK